MSTAIGLGSYAGDGLQVERFSATINDIPVVGQVILMERSCWVWFSTDSSCELGSLVVSMPTRYDTSAVKLENQRYTFLLPPNPHFFCLLSLCLTDIDETAGSLRLRCAKRRRHGPETLESFQYPMLCQL